jgi:hypothetical protein
MHEFNRNLNWNQVIMKLKATIKYDSKNKLLPHITKCPFSRNEIRRCFKYKYDFVSSRFIRYVLINWTTQGGKKPERPIQWLVSYPTPLLVSLGLPKNIRFLG